MQDIMSFEEDVVVSNFGQSKLNEYDYVQSLRPASGEAKGSPNEAAYRVLLCETQPLLIEGVKSLLRSCSDLKLVGAVNSLATAAELVRQRKPHVVILDKGFGLPAVADWIGYALAQEDPPAIVIWGGSVTEAEAVRFVHSGATGVVCKNSDPEVFLECVRSASRRMTWLENPLSQPSGTQRRQGRSNLTPREQQVVELVEQGMKNKEIAQEMGIQPGTVKIHLKHIFEKTGVRGRFGLALAGLRHKGLLNYTQK